MGDVGKKMRNGKKKARYVMQWSLCACNLGPKLEINTAISTNLTLRVETSGHHSF